MQDLIDISKNKAKGFKIKSHTTMLVAEEYTEKVKENPNFLNHVELNVNIKYGPIKHTRHLVNTLASLNDQPLPTLEADVLDREEPIDMRFDGLFGFPNLNLNFPPFNFPAPPLF